MFASNFLEQGIRMKPDESPRPLLKESKRNGKAASANLFGVALPLAIIGALFYTAFFVKPVVSKVVTKPPTIEKRDIFFGLARIDSTLIWAVGQHGKIIHSTDGGKTWSRQDSGSSQHLQSIAAWSSNEAVVVGNAGTVLRTENGGASWEKVSLPSDYSSSKMMRVRVFPNKVAWVVGERGTILTSQDGGLSWTAPVVRDDTTWMDIAMMGARGVLVGEFGQVRTTSDGGTTWSDMRTISDSTINSVGFSDPEHGIAVGTGGIAFATKNGGESWDELPKPTHQHLYDVFWDGTQWIAAGDKGVLLMSSAKDGRSWRDAGVKAGGWHTQVQGKDGEYLLAGYGVSGVSLSADSASRGSK